MRHRVGSLAVAAGLAVTASTTDAAPRHHKAKHHHRLAPAADEALDEKPEHEPAHERRRHERDDRIDVDEPAPIHHRAALAFADDAIDDTVDQRTDVHEHVTPHHDKDWRVAVGPYLWVSSVDANVSLGSATVGSSVDFVQMEQHARYGAEMLAEVGYGRLSLTGDLMYGVVALDGASSVGPLMVTVSGEASSLLVDGAAGYLVAGDPRSLLSLEARAGVRYQRTTIGAQIGVAGSTPSGPPPSVDAGRDALAGARVFVRPSSWFYLSGTFDVGVFGSSDSTWSATADANVTLMSRVQLSLGYRTLTIDRTSVSLVMHGPRAAIQLVF